MLWQAVSCSRSLLWSVGFLQTLVVVFQNLPLWWQLNLAAELSIKSIWLYCLALLQPLAEWKENRHQSLLLVRGLLSKCGGMLALMARQIGLSLRRNHFNVISRLVIRMCSHPYISLCVCQEWRSESAKNKKKSQTAQISTGMLQEIFYTWGRCALLKKWESSFCDDEKHFPLCCFSLFTPSLYWSFWVIRVQGRGSEHVSTLHCSLLMTQRSVNDWEMRWRWKQRCVCVFFLLLQRACFLFAALWVPVVEVMDKHLRRQSDIALQRKVIGSNASRCIRMSRKMGSGTCPGFVTRPHIDHIMKRGGRKWRWGGCWGGLTEMKSFKQLADRCESHTHGAGVRWYFGVMDLLPNGDWHLTDTPCVHRQNVT